MSRVKDLIPDVVRKNLRDSELEYLEGVFERFGGRFPELEEIWKLMDEPWRELNCDPAVMDERIGQFYDHPIWLLNGLFIEQHDPSLKNREGFTDWVVRQSPSRITDFGGGFGSLARMIGDELPAASIEVIDPHPHPAGEALAANTSNVKFAENLTGEYDIIIATDVFEHVPDPSALATETAAHLRVGGQYLIANCFHPVILCHLPQSFHFLHSWDQAMNAVGLKPEETVVYGRSFCRLGELDIAPGREIEAKSRKLHRLTRFLPGRVGRPLTRLLLNI